MKNDESVRMALLAEHERRNPRKFLIESFIETNPTEGERILSFAAEWIALKSEGVQVSVPGLTKILKAQCSLPHTVSEDAVRSWIKWRFET